MPCQRVHLKRMLCEDTLSGAVATCSPAALPQVGMLKTVPSAELLSEVSWSRLLLLWMFWHRWCLSEWWEDGLLSVPRC